MPHRVKRTKTDEAFLSSVSNALSAYKDQTGASNAKLADSLGIDESTVAKYIRKEAPIMAEVLARACIELEIPFEYKNYRISASSFGSIPSTTPQSAVQLEFLFDAGYSTEKNQWRISQRRAEPMEFNLRIKIAS